MSILITLKSLTSSYLNASLDTYLFFPVMKGFWKCHGTSPIPLSPKTFVNRILIKCMSDTSPLLIHISISLPSITNTTSSRNYHLALAQSRDEFGAHRVSFWEGVGISTLYLILHKSWNIHTERGAGAAAEAGRLAAVVYPEADWRVLWAAVQPDLADVYREPSEGSRVKRVPVTLQVITPSVQFWEWVGVRSRNSIYRRRVDS